MRSDLNLRQCCELLLSLALHFSSYRLAEAKHRVFFIEIQNQRNPVVQHVTWNLHVI